jgi:exodeoxyribonuclease V gamma subunit
VLTVHRAERATELVAALAAVLADPAGDPFAAEVVAVPSRGIERWLAQRLSHVLGAGPARADGVCANVEFPSPGRLVGVALEAVTGIDPAADAWAPGRAVWTLMDVIDDHLADRWMATLSSHLGGPRAGAEPTRRARRFGAARRLTDLFDRYAAQRPSMIERWVAGDDTDDRGAALPADLAWQAELWRRLRARIDVPSPAERLAPACARLRDEPELLALPTRVALYGLTRLATTELQVLTAVAAGRDVHLLLLHPSPVRWDRLAAEPGAPPAHPLLATWGKDAEGMQVTLAGTPRRDAHHASAPPGAGLLHQLQADVIGDVRPPGAPLAGAPDRRLRLDPGDRSVQVHACFGRARQVEVLRDAVLHLLADDPTLEPRDVIVMCPDVETFAPLVHAVFGAGDDGDGDTDATTLRVRLADRALRQTNPILATVAALLRLATTRVSASELVDFAGLEPVRRRFRLDDEDLARIEEWVEEAGIRWGLDAAHRAPYQLDRLATNTWQAGLDRLLLGVSMTEDELPLVGGVLPLDDVDSGDIDRAGRLTELVARVQEAIDALGRPQTLATFAATIAAAADGLTACPRRESWQRGELDRVLRDLVTEAGAGPAATTTLTLPELHTLIAQHLQGRPTRSNFRTGHITVCTLVPMRSVPHRVVCLLGLDDGVFPRHGGPDGDDIVERLPRAGDRDARSEDRQLLLDALLAAGDHLLVTYGGRDERTNAPRPPSVPIGELLDVIDATAVAATGRARGQVVVEHPLQPFDARNFEPGALVPATAWSFDRSARDGARALQAPRTAAAPFLPGPLAATATSLVDLDDLVTFVQHPTRAFLRQRLGVGVSDVDDDLDDAVPIELDGLRTWAVGDRLLAARLVGVDPEDAVRAEKARGSLPPLALGQRVIDEVWPLVDEIAAAATAARGGVDARTVDVRVDLGADGVVAGTVAGLHGSTLVTSAYATVGPRHRLAAWVRLLALAASEPAASCDAVTIGRAGRRVGTARIPAVAAPRAVAELRTLVDLYRRGLREPLPIFARTSELLARRPARAADAWETTDRGFPKEDLEPEHLLRFGHRQVPFGDLLAEAPRADETGPGWDDDATSRAARYARRLWAPLLAVEQRSWPW